MLCERVLRASADLRWYNHEAKLGFSEKQMDDMRTYMDVNMTPKATWKRMTEAGQKIQVNWKGKETDIVKSYFTEEGVRKDWKCQKRSEGWMREALQIREANREFQSCCIGQAMVVVCKSTFLTLTDEEDSEKLR